MKTIIITTLLSMSITVLAETTSEVTAWYQAETKKISETEKDPAKVSAKHKALAAQYQTRLTKALTDSAATKPTAVSKTQQIAATKTTTTVTATTNSKIPAEITIAGQKLALKDKKEDANNFIAEYIPSAETFDNFTYMFSIYGIKNSTANEQLKAKAAFVQGRKGKDPVANYNIFVADGEKSYGLDFLISEGVIMEHNTWRFIQKGNNVLAYQLVRRHYDGKSKTAGTDFIKQVKEKQSEHLTELNKDTLPIPAGY